MGLVPELVGLRLERPSVVTVGRFDGVHRGHQHLLARVRQEAQARQALSVAITLFPDPRTIHDPDFRPSYLESLEDRLALLQPLVDEVVLVRYTRELSRLTARQFVSALVEDLGMVCFVAGPDHTLGRDREGTIPVLTALGEELGYEVVVVEPLILEDGTVVSSTAVRRHLEAGEVARVRELLGRPFTVRGTVQRGAGRGRTLGYPTANLAPQPGLALPADGVYATRARLGDRVLPSVTNVGTRPTFGDGERLIEVHLLDYAGADLYGQELQVAFLDRLRPEVRYESVEALIGQMHQDAAWARQVLSAHETAKLP
jgi:riboflavin kinase/FMN adenylyltransferase